jgi:hypothetical protein
MASDPSGVRNPSRSRQLARLSRLDRGDGIYKGWIFCVVRCRITADRSACGIPWGRCRLRGLPIAIVDTKTAGENASLSVIQRLQHCFGGSSAKSAAWMSY